MQDLIAKIQSHEDWLLQRLAEYVKKHGYTKYTSTLEEAWRLTIEGLSDSLIECLTYQVKVGDLEFDVDGEANESSARSVPVDVLLKFALTEALRHRKRGVTLTMFVGLIKYCRYTYLDLVTFFMAAVDWFTYCNWLNRAFDRIEMAVTSSWFTEDEITFNQNLKESNRQLANEKNKYLTVFESTPAPVLLLGPNKEIDNLNLAAVSLFIDKASPGTQYYGTPIQNTALTWLVEELDNLSKDKSCTIIKDLVTVRGIRTFSVGLSRMCDISGKFNGFVVILNDVTEAHRIAEAHDFYLQILNDFPAFIWRTDEQGTVNYYNRNLLTFLGLGKDSTNIPKWTDYVRPEQLKKIMTDFCSAFQNRCSCQQEFQVRRHDGQYVWLQNSGVPFHDARGQFAGFIGIGQDITDQKMANDCLRRSEEDYRLLVEHLPDAILVHNGYQVVFANTAAHTLFGRRDIIGHPVEELIHPDYLLKARQRINEVLKQGTIGETIEQKILNNLGELVDVEVTLVPLTYHGQRVVQVVFRDITERKQHAEQVIRQSKLESLGLLAGGIAHDFNNILTIIVGNISLIKQYNLSDAKIVNKLLDIEEAALEAKNLTCQLLTFAKGGAPQKQILNVGKLLAAGTHFALSGANVSCELVIPPDLWLVEADSGQINQVINNLVINAKEAMPSGGTLMVKGENYLEEDHGHSPKRWVKLTFLDSGPGIPSEVLASIFDPYFTTKSWGSGLGLTTAYSIMTKHNGILSVRSKPGNGTEFSVFLPALDTASFVPIHPHIHQEKSNYEGRILVMDDEINVREITRAMLTHLGLTSDLVGDGKDLLVFYQLALVSGTPYTAVIMDLTVPGGLGGKDTIRELLKIDPRANVIVASGYSDDPVMANYHDFGFAGCLHKPYSIEELEKCLASVIGT